jgi:sugar lactone lactonase YvrE
LFIVATLAASSFCLAQDPVLDLYQRGAAAAQDGDDALYLASMDEASRLAPGNPILLRHCAQALVRLGRTDEAFARLRAITALGASFDFGGYDDLAPLLKTDGWPAFEADHLASRGPSGSMELAFTLSEEDLIPEGIAYDAQADAFLLSSTAKRKIVRATRDGNCSDFIASGEHGYLCGLGLALDASRRRLWAVSDAPENAGLFDETTVGHSAVHVFDLDDGRLLFSHDFAPDEAGAFSLNDVTLLPNGDAVATASARGSLHLLPADGGDPREIVPAGRVGGANGIAVEPGGAIAYVSQYSIGIQRVDLASGQVESASRTPSFSSCFVDGLYLRDRRLFAVQNYGGLDRIVSFGLDESGHLADCRVHVARQEVFVDPTTGTFADGRFNFIADSRVEPFFSRKNKAVTIGFGNTHIYSIPLLEEP